MQQALIPEISRPQPGSPPPCAERRSNDRRLLSREFLADGGEDGHNNAVHISQNGGVGEAQNLEAMLGQHTRPLAIPPLSLVRIMLPAIGFNHKAAGHTAEVRNIGSNRDLPSKMRIPQLHPMTKRPPEPLLGHRERRSHVLSEVALAMRGRGKCSLSNRHEAVLIYYIAYVMLIFTRCKGPQRSACADPHPVRWRGRPSPQGGGYGR